jgi:glycine cleavage system aminomethyltransferase T
MKHEWKDFLQNAGAEFENDCVATFGNPERERRITHTGDLFCDQSHFGIIAAYGEDAAEFLQAQFTNDIRAECCAISASSDAKRPITWCCRTSCWKPH